MLGIGSTLYVGHIKVACFFSAKVKKSQIRWLPCELEALAIALSIRHLAPFIIQSLHVTKVLTDSKPCVQAVAKLYKGEFSASPRCTSLLNACSQYNIPVLHIEGKVNLPSDFARRNPIECDDAACQICRCVDSAMDEIVIRNIGSATDEPSLYTGRPTWLHIQSECGDLRRIKAHLHQGTRPSKKLTHILDIKRYLQ